MPTAAFTTLGCKVNQYETQRILDDFEAHGFQITEFNQVADVYLVNTCSVTQSAERKSKNIVRKLARQNPKAVVIMTGCCGEMAKIKGEMVPEATLTVPNHQKLQSLQHLLAAYPEFSNLDRTATSVTTSETNRKRTRATIKIQDGCNVFCAFCSIPYTRKYLLSRTPGEIVAEVTTKVEQGYREIVVTGVLVGAYGQDRFVPTSVNDIPRVDMQVLTKRKADDGDTNLASILLQIAAVPGVDRVRLSSIEPTQITDTLLAAFAAEPKLCPHLHIPLQSGDSSVLMRMNRPYDQQFYLDRCRKAYSEIPNLAITSDIMVGFPGESRMAFENTLRVVEEAQFARAHVFRFSARPNTPAAAMDDTISEAEKLDRSIELVNACRKSQKQFISRFIGKTVPVLVEGKGAAQADHEETAPDRVEAAEDRAHAGSKLLSGYSDNYIRVQFTGGSHLCGKVVSVTLLEPCDDGALGEVGNAHFSPTEAPPDAEFIPLSSLAGILAEV